MQIRNLGSRLVMGALALAMTAGLVPAQALAQTTSPVTAAIETENVTHYASEESYFAANPDAERPLGLEQTPIVAQSAYWTRLQGSNRYETMRAIAQATYMTCPWAILASDNNFPDALAASSLAGARRAPVLLVGRYGIPSETREELLRLGIQHAYVVGGEAVVGYEVEGALSELGISYRRIAGSDRQDTSREVARELRRVQEAGETTTVSDVAIVATGTAFADALSIAPWAYATASPILLTNADGTLTDAQVEFVKTDARIKRIVMVGGTSAVSDTVKDQLGAYEYERLAGSDRYRTSAEVATWECGHGFAWNGVVVATGKNFPDALTGAALAGSKKVPLVLGDEIRHTSFSTLRSHKDEITSGYILGGAAAMPVDDPLDYVDDSPTTIMAQQYSSDTEWLILIDCTNNHCDIYHGSKDHWERYDDFGVTTGKDDHPTVRGTYFIYDHGYSFDGDV